VGLLGWKKKKKELQAKNLQLFFMCLDNLTEKY